MSPPQSPNGSTSPAREFPSAASSTRCTLPPSTSTASNLHPSSASAHAELADALTCARDATADVAEAVSIWGADGVDTILHEWRGALFRVRLARMRLATPAPRAVVVEDSFERDLGRPLVAITLALAGALAFAAGATLQLWPLWVAGLVAVCGSVVAYRPS